MGGPFTFVVLLGGVLLLVDVLVIVAMWQAVAGRRIERAWTSRVTRHRPAVGRRFPSYGTSSSERE